MLATVILVLGLVFFLTVCYTVGDRAVENANIEVEQPKVRVLGGNE